VATFPPSPPEEVLNTSNLAKLFKVDLKTEQLTEIFDFGKYEIINNPDRGDVVTNPYDFVIGGNTAYTVDAGGNTVYKIGLDGSGVTPIAIPKKLINDPVFPPLPPGAEIPPGLVEIPPGGEPTTPGGPPTQVLVQSVTTGAAIASNGDLFVGEYLGFPYPAGEARIFKIGEDNKPEIAYDGFSNITDLTFDKDGNLLVLQFSDIPQFGGDLTSLPGSLIQVAPDGTRTTLVAAGQGLESADGITVGPDGEIYITNRGVGPELGSVVRLDDLGNPTAVPEPSSILGMLAFGTLGGRAWLKRRKKQGVGGRESRC
jgi:hypothetical protein